MQEVGDGGQYKVHNGLVTKDRLYLECPLLYTGGKGAVVQCVEMGFYVDISWESRCNIEINV